MTQEARAWLLDNGYNVKPKGRIPSDLLAVYHSHAKADKLEKTPPKKKRTSCGFCTVRAEHQHKLCPGEINQGRMGIWTCLCFEKGHTLHVLRV